MFDVLRRRESRRPARGVDETKISEGASQMGDRKVTSLGHSVIRSLVRSIDVKKAESTASNVTAALGRESNARPRKTSPEIANIFVLLRRRGAPTVARQ